MKGKRKQKELDEMDSKELGRLFPIILSEPKPVWAELFIAEKDIIENTIGKENIERIEHIGSTAVPGLISKPTIDILIELKKETVLQHIIDNLKNTGYHYIPKPENPPPHMMFVKGYTKNGFEGQAYHVHVRYQGDWAEIYFRDYLKSHTETAFEYAELKKELAKKYKHDRDGYTEAKTDFIKNAMKKIKKNNN